MSIILDALLGADAVGHASCMRRLNRTPLWGVLVRGRGWDATALSDPASAFDRLRFNPAMSRRRQLCSCRGVPPFGGGAIRKTYLRSHRGRQHPFSNSIGRSSACLSPPCGQD